MARSFPTPDYTTTVQLGTTSTAKRKFSTVSPGVTDSMLTKGPPVTEVAGQAYYLSPEIIATAAPLNPVGTASGMGWGLVPSDPSSLVPLITDGWTLSSGTFTVSVVVSRDTTSSSSDQTCAFTAILFRADATGTIFPQELGRQTAAPVTITVVKTAFPITVTVPATTFNPGEILWLELYASATIPTQTVPTSVASIASYATNSLTGMAITGSTCTYVINFNKSLSDSEPVSDVLARQLVSNRTISDTAVISDSITRAASFPRTFSEPLTTVADTLARKYMANELLSDSVTNADSIARKYSGIRALGDTTTVSDSLVKGFVYYRTISDILAIVYRPVLIFEE